MSPCCGEKRARLQGAPTAPGETAEAISLYYLGRLAIVLQGTATGRRYGFSPGRPVHPVDIRDAVSLLESGLFRRARTAV